MTLIGDADQTKPLTRSDQQSSSNETIQAVLAAAARSCQLDVVNFLLKQYPDVPLNEEPVRAAVNTGSIPIFEALMARDPSIINMYFEKRGSPLTVACMGRQSLEYLQFLLDAGADPNQDPDAADFPLALVAALYKDPSAIDLLLQYGAALEHSRALTTAAFRGNEPMVQRLLDRGARLDTDASDIGVRESPLCVAVRKGHVGVVKVLLQYGTDPNAIDASGTTAIAVAKQMSLHGKDMTQMLSILEGER